MNQAANYIRLIRPSHWIKNVFVLPGIFVAVVLSDTPPSAFVWRFWLGMASVCLLASANYVLNEWMDSKFDQFHPVKKSRPAVVGELKPVIVYCEYVSLLILGLAAAWSVNSSFFTSAAALSFMGLIYNVPPVRSKDIPYLDVLSESVNNPIRLLMGWFIVTPASIAPSSLILSYWMGGAFLMAIKRFAELRFLSNTNTAHFYRRSFRYYTEEKLLISAFFYAICCSFFLGVFLIKHRIDLIFSMPFLAGLFAWYLKMSFQVNSPAQYPERLYRERFFLFYCFLVAALIVLLFFVPVPWSHWFLESAFIDKS